MRVVSISNQKGGCGKTTTAINLAASLAQIGKRTLLIDLDPQAHATTGLGIKNDQIEHSIYNVLSTQEGKKKNFMEDVIVPIDENLDLAPSHILLSTIEQEFTNKDESVSRLHDILESVSFPYQYVIIDCPPSLGFLTFNALRASHYVLVPIELGSFSLMGVGKLLSMIELIRVKLSHSPQVFALPTMVDLRSNFAKHMITQIRDSFSSHVFKASIRQNISVRESQARGETLLRFNPKSKAAMDYLHFAQELVEKVEDLERPSIEPLSTRGRGSTPSECLKEFTLELSEAREIHIVGDFNGWKINGDSLLWQKEKGVWQKRLHLTPGKYRYKFVIDGQWVTDPHNEHFESNPYGGVDSVLEVN